MTGRAKSTRTIHVGFTVSDLDRSIAMFTDLFGYEIESRGITSYKGVALLTGVEGANLDVVHLRHPDLVTVELMQYLVGAGAQGPAKRPCDVSFAHLTYQVEDIEAAVAAAAAHGLQPVGRIVHSSRDPANLRRVVYLRDPDGIHLELIQHTGAGGEA